MALWRPVSNPLRCLRAAGQCNWICQPGPSDTDTAVSASVYLSKLCGCHPASQAAIAQPPPLPYQDNELHLGPLYELTLRTFAAAKRGPCANDGQRECGTGLVWAERTETQRVGKQ